MKPPIQRRRGGASRRAGALTIEFALIMVMGFVPIVLALFEWSWFFLQASLVQTAVWEAAHQGAAVDMALTCPDATAEAKVDEILSNYGISGAAIDSELQSVDYGVGPPTTIDQLHLTVTVPYPAIFNGVVYVPSSMGADVTVPLEQQTGYGGC